MVRVFQFHIYKHGNSYVMTIPPEYRKKQSEYCRDNNKILVGLLSSDEIDAYESKCQWKLN